MVHFCKLCLLCMALLLLLFYFYCFQDLFLSSVHCLPLFTPLCPFLSLCASSYPCRSVRPFLLPDVRGGLSWCVSVQLRCFCSWCSSSVFYRYTTAKPFSTASRPLRRFIPCVSLALCFQIYPPGSAFIWSLGGTVQGCIIFKNSRT